MQNNSNDIKFKNLNEYNIKINNRKKINKIIVTVKNK